jgi:predicted metal-dependent phosphoesterase TrpH
LLIDLHLHTTASDGRCTPEELVARAASAGLTVLSVTDHDTTAALPIVSVLAVARGLEFVPGIEITAVSGESDVHVLGYFIDHHSVALNRFLQGQRADRVRRTRAIAARLAELGKPIDIERIVDEACGADRPVGRPHIAAALVRAGHTGTVREAFDTLIGEGLPAYVPRQGATPSEVVATIARAGGVASLAHPGLLGHDELIPDLARGGLHALEAYHSDHSPDTTAKYLSLAAALRLAVSGGSDYHGPESHHAAGLGEVALPKEHYVRLRTVAGRG